MRWRVVAHHSWRVHLYIQYQKKKKVCTKNLNKFPRDGFHRTQTAMDSNVELNKFVLKIANTTLHAKDFQSGKKRGMFSASNQQQSPTHGLQFLKRLQTKKSLKFL